eukprot:gene15561-25783_t
MAAGSFPTARGRGAAEQRAAKQTAAMDTRTDVAWKVKVRGGVSRRASEGGKRVCHFLFVLSDDMGWADASWHREAGYKEVSTPKMEALAKYCSPSRSAVQTGRNPIHVNVNNLDPSSHNPNNPDQPGGHAAIPRGMTGIAALLKAKANYSTHFVGKWDAGMATPDQTPRGKGYDSALSFFYHENDYWNFTVDDNGGAGPRSCAGTGVDANTPIDLWLAEEGEEEGKPAFMAVPTPLNNSVAKCTTTDNKPYPDADPDGKLGICNYEDALFLDRTKFVVDRYAKSHTTAASQKDAPLFLFYSPHIVHEPLQVPKYKYDEFEFIPFERRRRYHAMVSYMDDAIDDLVAAYKQNSLWENTLMVFSADNGGPIYRWGDPGANNFPLRGGKASNWEGGIRVNAFVAGELAGIDDVKDYEAERIGLPAVDSISMAGYITGKLATSPRKVLPLGQPDGWRDIWGGPTRYPVVNGIIVDKRDEAATADPADGSGAGKLWKLMTGDEAMN